MSRSKTLSLIPLLALVVLVAVFAGTGCKQLTPEEKVAEMRSNYEATVNTGGFVVTPHEEEVVVEADVPGDPDAETAEEAPAEEGEGEEGMEEEVPLEPVSFDVTLDIVVSNGNSETMPQLTIDVVHAAGDETEKMRYYAVIDATNIHKGGSSQVSYTLESIPYVEGDIFYTEVRHPVPEGDREHYPEFTISGN